MHDGTYCLDYSDWVVVLPDVPPHVDPHGAVLQRIVDKLEYVLLGVEFGTAGHNEWNRASVNNLREPFAVVCLYDVGPHLGSQPATQTQITGVPFVQLLSDGCYGHDGHSA